MAVVCLPSVFVAPGKLASVSKVVRSKKVAARAASTRAVVMTTPELKSQIQQKISEAQETCADPKAKVECAVAWDEVEEISSAAANKDERAKAAAYADPLDKFCDDNPEADECRVYSD